MSRKHILVNQYENNINTIKEKLKNAYDVKYREITTSKGFVCAIFIDNMVDHAFLSDNILAPLLDSETLPENIEQLKKEVIESNVTDTVQTIDEAILNILSGNVILFFSFCEGILYCEVKGMNRRAIEQPITETTIKGPREGFVEDLAINISLIRRRIMNPGLKIEDFRLGGHSQIGVALIYLEQHAPEKLVTFIRTKIKMMQNRHFVFAINNIEEELRSKNTFFNTIGYSERPDIIASNLSEGRVCVMVNGTPFVLIAPYFFIDHFMSPDDYYNNMFIGSFDRILRWLAFSIAMILPALYLALTTYHFKLIPTVLVFRVAVLRSGVPFNTVIEIFIMYFFFLILREAGIRLPSPIGQAISIFGALILGDAAIGAGLTSQITVLVVALSSICTFLIPTLFNATVVWTSVLLLFTALSGLPGFYIAFIMFISHIAGLTTCGYPFLYPLGTLTTFKFRDIFYRKKLKDISNNILHGDEK
ncbi:spore germination protein [Serpentinicella alkaliphila]|uniref:GerA spore germination protein n=1 Tax=Serpentinicella alkaliphila TaxID=1734049 RepID=A0A4R2TR13_9FIRM|nr:spore germination protein [Serpentinicella alkaliphila]QUH24760.1 spore germination protein [Serpentinicella alkaliphila]TCQ03755.1 GerA spore germination protein [Serpentinicella alkaliphila]